MWLNLLSASRFGFLRLKFFCFCFLNPNLYTARVLQRYRSGHVLSTCVVGCVSQLGLTMGGGRVEFGVVDL